MLIFWRGTQRGKDACGYCCTPLWYLERNGHDLMQIVSMDSARPSNFIPSQPSPNLSLDRVLLLVLYTTPTFFRHWGRSYLLYHWCTASLDGDRVPALLAATHRAKPSSPWPRLPNISHSIRRGVTRQCLERKGGCY